MRRNAYFFVFLCESNFHNTMKTSILVLLLLSALLAKSQVFTQSNIDGSIIITPKGLKGNSNSLNDTTSVALGPFTLKSNIAGKNNTAIGHSVLTKNSHGILNTGVGYNALSSTTGGNNNVAIGARALESNTMGHSNIATGMLALGRNTTGGHNVATGYLALTTNTTGYYNSATGSQALYMNYEGSDNTANGASALYSNFRGTFNTSVGSKSMYFNETGNANTAVGTHTLYQNSTGSENTALGQSALYLNRTGNGNTAVGVLSLFGFDRGNYNTAIGYESGIYHAPGDLSTFIGYRASGMGNTNATAIGANAIVNESNKVRIGNTSVTVIEGQVAWSTPSDRHLKENIVYTTRLGLDFIYRLQTVSYSYLSDKTKVRHDGFIAQDVEQVMKELDVPFSGLKKAEDGTYSLAYSDFVMPLVNAVKELKQRNEILEVQMATLAQTVADLKELKAEMDKIKSANNQGIENK